MEVNDKRIQLVSEILQHPLLVPSAWFNSFSIQSTYDPMFVKNPAILCFLQVFFGSTAIPTIATSNDPIPLLLPRHIRRPPWASCVYNMKCE